jgi:hypothetical protein
MDDESLQKEIEEGQKQKKQSEWQKIERMMINDERTEKQVHQLMVQAQAPANANMIIDQNVLIDIEKNGGFPP